MIGRPQNDEAAPYYFTYINQVSGENISDVIAAQVEESLSVFSSISEEKSRHRYAPDKWSIRQLLNHRPNPLRPATADLPARSRSLAVST